MFRKLLYIVAFLPVFAFGASTGERLVNTFWQNAQAKNYTAIAPTISNHFAGIARIFYDSSDESVTMTKTQMLQFLEFLDIAEYTITNLQSVRNEHNLVITYDVSVTQAKSPILKSLAGYQYHILFVYERKDHQWKLISASAFPFNLQ